MSRLDWGIGDRVSCKRVEPTIHSLYSVLYQAQAGNKGMV